MTVLDSLSQRLLVKVIQMFRTTLSKLFLGCTFIFELLNLNSESNGQSNAMAIKTSKVPNIFPKWDLFCILLACLPLQSAAVS